MSEQTNTPLVSIICLTYNHAPYIRECIDGFLMQETDFPFEVIIHDDASTDDTYGIIREYAEQYPNLFRIIRQKENQYSISKSFRGIIKTCLSKAKGKYIAFCEGDDYWTDSQKLAKQVQVLIEKNVDLVYTDLSFRTGSDKVVSNVYKNHIINRPLSYVQMLEYCLYMAPCTWVLKRDWFEIDHGNILDETYAISLDICANGKIYFLEDNTSVYRVLSQSATHTSNPNKTYERSISLLNISKKSIETNQVLLSKKEQNRIISKRLLTCFKYSCICKDCNKYSYLKEIYKLNDFPSIIKASAFLIYKWII